MDAEGKENSCRFSLKERAWWEVVRFWRGNLYLGVISCFKAMSSFGRKALGQGFIIWVIGMCPKTNSVLEGGFCV